MEIGSDVVKRLCRYLFQNTDLLRIFAEPFAYNQASCRILEKAGFALEDVLKSVESRYRCRRRARSERLA